MERIRLDFIRRHAFPGTLSWSLGGLGLLVLLLFSAWAYGISLKAEEHAREVAAQLRQSSAQLDAGRPKGVRFDGQQIPEEWNRAIKVSTALNNPWGELLGMLEEQVERPVGLLSVEADAVRHEITLFAEAKNFDEMLAFINMLKERDFLHSVILHAHQENRQDRENPVRFRVTAGWVDR
jgi:Tfp pilus assembly protein PilN